MKCEEIKLEKLSDSGIKSEVININYEQLNKKDLDWLLDFGVETAVRIDAFSVCTPRNFCFFPS